MPALRRAGLSAAAAGAELCAPVRFPGSGWLVCAPAGFVFTTSPVPGFRHPQGGNIEPIEIDRTTSTPEEAARLARIRDGVPS
jgi:hypothetical protein